MIATIHKITRLSYKKVTYYTVIVDDKVDEFNDFLNRVGSNVEYRTELGQILQYIKDIGEVHGAHKFHFRHERAAEALPPGYHQFIETDNGEYGLRLYCIRLSDSVVVLLNGDMKTHLYPDQCKNCKKHFELANKISKKINESLNREILIKEKEIEFDDDFVIYL